MSHVSLNPVYSFSPPSHYITPQLDNSSSSEPMAASMSSAAYAGPTALGSSRYASPAKRTAQLAAASAFPITAPSAPDTTIATKQQIAAAKVVPEMTPPAADLAVQQGSVLRKHVEEHTAKFNRAVSNAVVNTRQLLMLLREATPGSEVVEKLWEELEQLFEAASKAKAALPVFMEKQRDNMSLYHSSMMNETIRETQDELNLQHKKVNTQHSLIIEQQDAFQNYKAQTDSKLKELEGLQERVSRLTLEKGNFRTEVDKYKELLEQETTQKAENVKTVDALQKELETLVSSKKQLQDENETLRRTTTDMLEQLKNTEQRVTDRFTMELKVKVDELQKETIKTASLNTLVNALKTGETGVKKELDKLKSENRLISVKYSNQASEHAAAFTKLNDQNKKIEALTADVGHLRKRNTDLQVKLEQAAELTNTNNALSKAKDDLSKQMDNLAKELNEAKDDAKNMQGKVHMLKAKLAVKDAVLAVGNDKALFEKVKGLEEKRESLEAALAEWTELAKRSYKEYKDMLPTYMEAEKHRQDAREKEAVIGDLQSQLAAAKGSQSNGVGADATYWKQKYETLLSTIDG